MLRFAKEAGMKTKGRTLLFWVLVVLFMGAALWVLAVPPVEPGWKGKPGVRLAP